MTRRFRVTIGGVTYNVDVEELGQAAPAAAGFAAGPVAVPPAGAAGAVPAAPTVTGPVGPNPAAVVPAGPASAPAGPAAAVPAAAPAGPAAAAAPAPAPAVAPAAAPAAGSPSGEGQAVCAPLPGMIVDVKVTVGQQVCAGEVVAVLEAMKMENDITTPYAGTVKQVLVSKGASVSMNDPLVVIG